MSEIESQIYNHANELLRSHDVLLRDKVRNRAFYAALERTVNSDSHVLDIGAGAGIWAVTAAKLGAPRVVAIEMDEFLIGLIKMLAAEHGVADRIETVWGNSFEIQLEREFDIVVSETVGYVGFDENIAEIMRDARTRFLKPGGKLIPETISLHAAPARLHEQNDEIPAGLCFDLTRLAELSYHSPYLLKHRDEIDVLADAVCLIETDLYGPDCQSPEETLCGTWELDKAGTANCFALWVESRLTEGVTLSTRETTSWTPTLYRFEPRSVDSGSLRFDLELDPKGVSWSVSADSGGGVVTRQYSPAFAAAEMLAAARGLGSIEMRDGRMYIATTAPEIAVRPANAEDREHLFAVFASSKREQLEAVGWPAADVDNFLTMQFDIRTKAYAMSCPGAEPLVITMGGEPAGTILIDRAGGCITIVDIGVLPAFRKRGIASEVIGRLQSEAGSRNVPVLLRVDKDNPKAYSLYIRLGFIVISDNDLSLELKWSPSALPGK